MRELIPKDRMKWECTVWILAGCLAVINGGCLGVGVVLEPAGDGLPSHGEADKASNHSPDAKSSKESSDKLDSPQIPDKDAKLPPFFPRPLAHPSMGVDGGSGMHGGSAASDTTPFAGPGSKTIHSDFLGLSSACPTVLLRSDGLVWLLCTQMLDRSPVAMLLDPAQMKVLARKTLQKGALLGGVYAYVDEKERLVTAGAQAQILALSTHKDAKNWRIQSQVLAPLDKALEQRCGSADCDQVVSLGPGQGPWIWWVTRNGGVGLSHRETQTFQLRELGSGEQVHNSFASTPFGDAAIVSDHALYFFSHNASGEITQRWSATYDRGPARKPGQLSWGSGATPSFFGSPDPFSYITITDNARDQISLLIYDRTGRQICRHAIFGRDNQGTENSAIAAGRSVIVASTYGYPYPATPSGAGPSVPLQAPFVGGMLRVDLDPAQERCHTVWENKVQSAAVPKLSTASQLIYTVARRSELGGLATQYSFVSLDPHDGEVLSRHDLGGDFVHNTLQLAGQADAGGNYLQGSLGGVFRVSSGG